MEIMSLMWQNVQLFAIVSSFIYAVVGLIKKSDGTSPYDDDDHIGYRS